MNKPNLLYVYSMLFGRFNQECTKFKIDPCLIVDFLAMPKEVQNDFIDEYGTDGDFDQRVISFLSCVRMGEFEAKDKRKLLNGEPFYLMSEEYGYGFGYTKEDAMVAYTKGEQDNGAFDDGGSDW